MLGLGALIRGLLGAVPIALSRRERDAGMAGWNDAAAANDVAP